jgi:hypothetical protein
MTHRAVDAWTSFPACLLLSSLVFACGDDLPCPTGTYKDGSRCRKFDAGAMGLDEASVTATTDAESAGNLDGSPSSGEAASAAAREAGPVVVSDATTLPTDASAQVEASSAEAGPADAGMPSQPVGECDATRSCGAGYSCLNSTCVSACDQTKCDTNASCTLNGSSPVCTCNNGYVAQGAGTTLKCTKDVACEELRCHASASCEKGTDQLLHCVCKPGFMGSGTSCAPITCGALTIENGTVSGGSSFGDTATYKCNAGYELDLLVGSLVRRCGADQTWSGSPARCSPVSCGAPPIVQNASVSPGGAGTFGAKATYTCNSGYELTAGGEVRCQENGQWSTRPSCRPKCGNGRLDRDTEECDQSVPGTSKWSCSATCTEQTIYNPCFTSDDCTGVGEKCLLNTCTKSCVNTAGCPPSPVNTLTPACDVTFSGGCFLTGCTANSDCASGLTCQGEGVCGPCQANEWCGGRTCAMDASGTPVTVGKMGLCQ